MKIHPSKLLEWWLQKHENYIACQAIFWRNWRMALAMAKEEYFQTFKTWPNIHE